MQERVFILYTRIVWQQLQEVTFLGGLWSTLEVSPVGPLDFFDLSSLLLKAFSLKA